MPMGSPDASKRSSMRQCALGSAIGLTRQAGELVAIAHTVPKTGYKNPCAYGARPVFTSDVTTRHFVKQVRAAAESTCEHKHLMVYGPHAPRNRPKETMSNVLGRRYGVHPSSLERYKGESHVNFVDADPESRRAWRTTNMAFQTSAQVRDVVGLANSGIAADIARRMHKTQGLC